MEIILIHQQSEWSENLQRLKAAPSFLQSFAWGEILRAEGKSVERLAVRSAGVTLAAAQVIYVPLPLGWQYAFCPQGPTMKGKVTRGRGEREGEGEKVERAEICRTLTAYLQKKRCIFFRIEPDALPPPSITAQKTADINPRVTSRLDLTKPQAELENNFHKKTRYSLRQAAAAHLTLTTEKNFAVFWELLRATARHGGFRLHGERHYRAVVGSPFSFQMTAYRGQQPLASAVWIEFAGTMTYLFAASDQRARALAAPYLLQLEAIKLARRRGCRWYDFFGVAPPVKGEGGKEKNDRTEGDEYRYDPRHPYANFTRFKIRFGGKVTEAPGTFDLIISPWEYKMYRVMRSLRRWLPV